MKTTARQRHILQVTTGYGIIAALWILLSDALLAPLIDPVAIQWLSTVKGLLFVIVTTLLLFYALRAVPDRAEGAAIPASRQAATVPWLGSWVYLFAVAATLTILLLRLALPVPMPEQPMMVMFMFPVVISAMAGGLGPGLVATVIAALAVDYFAIEPVKSFWISQAHDFFQWCFLLADGVLISVLSEVFHRQRRQADAARQLQAVTLASIGEGVITTGNSGLITFMNPEAEQLTGWSASEAIGQPVAGVFRLCTEKIRAPLQDPAAKILATGTAIELTGQTLLLSHDDRELPVLGSGAPICLDDGSTQGVVMIFHDDTHRRRSETMVREERALFQDLVNNQPGGIYRIRVSPSRNWEMPADEEVPYRFDIISEHFCEILGVSRQELEKDPGLISRRIHPDDQASFNRINAEANTSLTPFNWEGRMLNGIRTQWVQFQSLPRQLDNGDILWTGLLNDIGARKQSEMALRESQAQFALLASLLERSSQPFSQGFPDGRLGFVNQAYLDLTGYSPQEISSLNWQKLTAPEWREKEQALIAQLHATGQPVRYEKEYVRKDGRRVPIEILVHLARDEEGNPLYYYSFFTDLTARKTLEGQLFQAQKMEFVGRLAGGVAHDFNNMLTVIGGHTELALALTAPDDPRFHSLQEIQGATSRSTNLTRQLLAFARKQTVSPKVLDLNETLGSMLKMLQRLIGENIDLTWSPGRQLWPVKIDPSQIDQLLANLAINARDAIAGVGKITIETTNRQLDTDYCAVHPDVTPGDYVELVVSDSGAGMSGEVLAHLFEPFYTTKEEGKGTGLGLATVYGIIKQNQGAINVYSEPGRGTTFRIYLPRHTDLSDQPEETVAAAPAPGGTETLLIVEDDPAILDLSKRFSERLGYRILTAGSPGEAIRLVKMYHGEGIALLITDVVMPEMNGKQLATQLKECLPGLKCLFMSGYTADAIARQGVLEEGICFLAKPFSASEMAVKIREALEK